ncbi:hypothetical protein D3C87_883000 [compost metagenome]
MQQEQVGQAGSDHHSRQHRIVVEHEHAVEDDHDRVDRRARQAAGEQVRDVVVHGDAVGDLTRVTLRVEGHGQVQEVLQEAAGMQGRELEVEAAQVGDPQLRQAGLEEGDHDEAQQQGAEPIMHPLDQNLIDEELGEDRQGHARHDQEEACEHAVEEIPVRAFEASTHGLDDARLAPALLEILARLEDQHHPGEALVELLERHRAAAARRVVQPDARLVHLLDDQVMVEVPEDDARKGDVANLLQGLLEALGVEAVLACGHEEVAGLAAVARDAAGDPQLAQRHDAAVIREDHGERGRAAFHALHLDDGRSPDAARSLEEGQELNRGHCWISGWRRPGRWAAPPRPSRGRRPWCRP